MTVIVTELTQVHRIVLNIKKKTFSIHRFLWKIIATHNSAAAAKIAGRDTNAVDMNQLAENQPAENSRLAEARERTPCTTRKKAESSAPRREPSSSSSESSAGRREPSSSINESSSSSSESSFYTCELSCDNDELSSSSDSETVMARYANVARKTTYAKAR